MSLAADLTIAPDYDIDFYSDEVLADPYPHYKRMRDMGPVVRLPQHDGYAITRFADVRDALRNPEVFISGRGVMMNDPVNQAAAGMSMLNMDDPAHKIRREIMAKPLMPAALNLLKSQIQKIADDAVSDLLSRRTFDGVSEFAHVLPLTLVSHLVGLPEEGRERMLQWAAAIFNVIGSINHRFAQGMPLRDEAEAYLRQLDRSRVLPGSWADRLFKLVDEGVLTDTQARDVLFDYISPALDTTINATSSAIWFLGQNPDQWDMVRADRSLISPAIEEAMRLETPIRAFSRYVTRDHDVGGTLLPEGARVLIVYASANRDERRWEDPERYDIKRKGVQEQLAFGTGVHMCAGMHLARMEMRCLFEAFANQVVRFEVSHPKRELHNVLRGLAGVTVKITQTSEA